MKTPEERRESKAFRELRKENVRLRRQLSELRRAVLVSERMREEDEAEEGLELVPDTRENPYECPKCGSLSTVEFSIMDRCYYRCESCGSKGQKKT